MQQIGLDPSPCTGSRCALNSYQCLTGLFSEEPIRAFFSLDFFFVWTSSSTRKSATYFSVTFCFLNRFVFPPRAENCVISHHQNFYVHLSLVNAYIACLHPYKFLPSKLIPSSHPEMSLRSSANDPYLGAEDSYQSIPQQLQAHNRVAHSMHQQSKLQGNSSLDSQMASHTAPFDLFGNFQSAPDSTYGVPAAGSDWEPHSTINTPSLINSPPEMPRSYPNPYDWGVLAAESTEPAETAQSHPPSAYTLDSYQHSYQTHTDVPISDWNGPSHRYPGSFLSPYHHPSLSPAVAGNSFKSEAYGGYIGLSTPFREPITGKNTPLLGFEEDDDANSHDEIPYAQLIFKALMDAEGHRMVLKDIYEWFEKNTNKPKHSTQNSNANTRGWQNSIRHNLSMNAVSLRPIISYLCGIALLTTLPRNRPSRRETR